MTCLGSKIRTLRLAATTPRSLAWFHLSQAAVWTAMIPVALSSGLKDSVPFLVTISLLALVFSELAAYQAARGERRQDPEDPYGSQDSL